MTNVGKSSNACIRFATLFYLLHQSEREIYNCPDCDKSFSSKDNLARHQLVHSAERNSFTCGVCQRKFNRVDNLKRHQASVHGRKEKYHCGDCDITFDSLFHFKCHRTQHHQKTRVQRGRGATTTATATSSATQSQTDNKHPQGHSDDNLQEDPVKMPTDILFPEESDQEGLRTLYAEHWKKIMTRHSRNNKVQDRYNFRLDTLDNQRFVTYLRKIFKEQKNAFKLNFSFGFVLRNNETGEYRYFHSSQNNHRYLDKPVLIINENDLDHFVQTSVANIDVLEWARQQRPNSKWVVDIVTNITFFVSKLKHHPIGAKSKLPKFIVRNKSIVALHRDRRTGEYFNDNLCFFRCLAAHSGCHTKNLEKTTHYYFNKYLEETGTSKSGFN